MELKLKVIQSFQKKALLQIELDSTECNALPTGSFLRDKCSKRQTFEETNVRRLNGIDNSINSARSRYATTTSMLCHWTQYY